MELTIMLMILSGMILAVVMISGIEMSSNTMLLSARNQAQLNARGTDPQNSSRSVEIGDWHYTKLDLTRNSKGESSGDFGSSVTLMQTNRNTYKLKSRDGVMQIPFSYQATSSGNGEVNTLNDATGKMTSNRYSRPSVNLTTERYNWQQLNDFDTSFQHDFAERVRDGNAFNAANLVSGTGSTSSGAATVNRKYQAEGRVSADNAASIMYQTFNNIFGVNISNIKMQDHPTNTVYLPVF